MGGRVYEVTLTCVSIGHFDKITMIMSGMQSIAQSMK